jgi:hypothetical protein
VPEANRNTPLSSNTKILYHKKTPAYDFKRGKVPIVIELAADGLKPSIYYSVLIQQIYAKTAIS